VKNNQQNNPSETFGTGFGIGAVHIRAYHGRPCGVHHISCDRDWPNSAVYLRSANRSCGNPSHPLKLCWLPLCTALDENVLFLFYVYYIIIMLKIFSEKVVFVLQKT